MTQPKTDSLITGAVNIMRAAMEGERVSVAVYADALRVLLMHPSRGLDEMERQRKLLLPSPFAR